MVGRKVVYKLRGRIKKVYHWAILYISYVTDCSLTVFEVDLGSRIGGRDNKCLIKVLAEPIGLCPKKCIQFFLF